MKSVSYTLSRNEVVDQLKSFLLPVLTDMAGDYLNGDEHARSVINSFFNVESWTNTVLAEKWCDLCSDAFFEKNPDVGDVLMLVEYVDAYTPMKEWLASRGKVKVDNQQ